MKQDKTPLYIHTNSYPSEQGKEGEFNTFEDLSLSLPSYVIQTQKNRVTPEGSNSIREDTTHNNATYTIHNK